MSNKVQPAASIRGIRFMSSVLAALLAIMGAITIVFYRLNSAKIKEVEHWKAWV